MNIRNSRYLILMAAVSWLVVSCAAGPSDTGAAPSIPPRDSGQGRIFIYRFGGFIGSANKPVITLNGQVIGRSVPGRFFYVDHPPGDCELVATSDFGSGESRVTCELTADQEVYVKLAFNMSSLQLQLVDPALGAREISRLKYAGRLDRSASYAHAGKVSRSEALRKEQEAASASRAASGAASKVARGERRKVSKAGQGRQEYTPGANADRAAGPAGTEASMGAAGGVYQLDSVLAFNVLDAAAIDPATGRITLVGHRDPQFGGPQIPYLEHLAELLDNPAPEFSLNWTPESQPRVEALFRNFSSPEYVGGLVNRWAEVMGPDGHPTGSGRWVLPFIGIKPTGSGERLGYLGTSVQEVPNKLQILSVATGSPAELAGLSPGEFIYNHGNAQEFTHTIRLLGEGGSLMLQIERNGHVGAPTNIVLGGAPGDPWGELDKFDLIERMLWAAGKNKGATLVGAYGRLVRIMKSTQAGFADAFNMLIAFSDDNDAYWRDVAECNAGRMSRDAALGNAFRAILAAMERAFDITDGQVTNAFDNARRNGVDAGSAFDQVLPLLNQRIEPSLLEVVKTLLARNDEIVVPPEVMAETIGPQVEVEPEFRGVDPRSALARVFYSADYLGKSLINRPDLQAKIPRYQSEFAFERDNPDKAGEWRDTGQNHLWFSIEKLDFAQSPDGNALQTRGAKIRINIREIGPAGEDAPPIPGGYGELLTSLYDDFEREFPVLHELRETAKIAGVAAWLKAKQPDLRLPRTGRASCAVPEKAPGVFYMTFSPKERPGRLAAALSAMGGLIWNIQHLQPGPGGYPSDESLARLRDVLRAALAHEDEDELALKLAAPPAGAAVPTPAGWTSGTAWAGGPARAVTIAVSPDFRDAPAPVIVNRDASSGSEVLWDRGELDRQIASLTVSLVKASSQHDQATLMLLIAQGLHDKGDDAAAVAALKAAMQLDPQNSGLKLLIAREKFSEGDIEGAKADLQAYVAATPGNQAAARLLAGIQSGAITPEPAAPAAAAPGSLEPFKPALEVQCPISVLNGPAEEAVAAARELPGIPAIHFQPKPLPPPPSVPAALAETWRQYQAGRNGLDEQSRAIDTQLQAIHSRETQGAAMPGDAAEAKSLGEQQTDLKQKVETADKKMENDIIEWDLENPSQPPAAGAPASDTSAP